MNYDKFIEKNLWKNHNEHELIGYINKEFFYEIRKYKLDKLFKNEFSKEVKDE